MDSVCSACGQRQRPGGRFCVGCGAVLAVVCSRCDSPVESADRFCAQCGEPVSAPLTVSPPALSVGQPVSWESEGERKQLTVLFADVQGSMALQEQLELEDWAGIVDHFDGILAQAARRFGGTVEFTGDGIMALFGAREAQEDHARRACHAAWQMNREIRAYAEELRRAKGLDLQVRVGLNSGEVVVARVGADLHLDPKAFGHTVGLGERMEALAVPGLAYLTESTARLVEGWFQLRDLGPMMVKGVQAPVGVYVLEGPLPPRPWRARRAGSTARLIGRGAEMAILEDALARAAGGDAQVVGVVGEPGVGKSRLCDEFVRSVLARGITVRRAAGVSHGREVPLLPILSLFRDYFGITDAISPSQSRERISDRLLGLDPGFRSDLPVFFDFLEVPDPERPAPPITAEVRMGRVFDALRRVTERRSEREVLVMVLEDLHWFDTQSTEWLGRLIESFPGSRTLVVTNFRPEFSASWMRHSYYRQIPLLPLSAKAVGEMVSELVGDDPSLAPLPDYLMERTGGNPFFVEEIVRALVEEGTLAGCPGVYHLTRPLDQASMPASVQSVLAARIDRLSAEHKPVLQTASVIGRTFAEALLAAVMVEPADKLREALAALCAAELLQESQRAPVIEYRFWHPLTQEVAYATMLAARRARLHATVAEALIEYDSDRLDEGAAVVAWHWERAGRKLDAARWNLHAGEFALRSDLSEALRRWRAAIDLLEGADATPEAMEVGVRARDRLLQFGARTGITSEEADRLEAEGRTLADRLGDRELLAKIVVSSGSARFWAGDIQGGTARYLEAAKHSDDSDDPDFKAAMWIAPVLAFTPTGPLAEGLAWGNRAIEVCAENPECGVRLVGYSILARVHQFRSSVLARMGRLREASADVEQALTLGRPRSEPETICWSLAMLPLLAWLTGDDPSCSAPATEAVRVAEETENPASLVMAFQGLALSHLVAGHPGEAVAACEQALAVARGKRSGLFEEASVLAHLALARIAAGDADGAMTAADEAVAVARRQGARVHECLALLARARVGRLGCRAVDQVTADLGTGLAIIGQVGALTYEPFLREELGRLRTDGRQLREAARLYEAIGATGHAQRLQAELDAQSSSWRETAFL
jgi:class 3 adenylate cyclase/tetratricopeptide (TPR) repeat protein